MDHLVLDDILIESLQLLFLPVFPVVESLFQLVVDPVLAVHLLEGVVEGVVEQVVAAGVLVGAAVLKGRH